MCHRVKHPGLELLRSTGTLSNIEPPSDIEPLSNIEPLSTCSTIETIDAQTTRLSRARDRHPRRVDLLAGAFRVVPVGNWFLGAIAPTHNFPAALKTPVLFSLGRCPTNFTLRGTEHWSQNSLRCKRCAERGASRKRG